jgi:hypothetical protein
MERRSKKLLDHVRNAIRLKHYSIRTEDMPCSPASSDHLGVGHPGATVFAPGLVP